MNSEYNTYLLPLCAALNAPDGCLLPFCEALNDPDSVLLPFTETLNTPDGVLLPFCETPDTPDGVLLPFFEAPDTLDGVLLPICETPHAPDFTLLPFCDGRVAGAPRVGREVVDMAPAYIIDIIKASKRRETMLHAGLMPHCPLQRSGRSTGGTQAACQQP